MTEALRTALPGLSQQARTGLVKRFVESPPIGRALAVHPPTGTHAEASGSATNAAATTYVLERCAYRAGRPCALITVGSEVLTPDASGIWPWRTAALLEYIGLFDPDRLPTR